MREFIVELLDCSIEFEIFLLNFSNVVQSLAGLLGLGFQFLDNSIDIAVPIGHIFRIFNNNLTEPQSPGNLKGIGATGNPLHKVVGRAEAIDVKLHAGILHMGSLNAVSLELWIVGRGHGLDVAEPQVLQNRHS